MIIFGENNSLVHKFISNDKKEFQFETMALYNGNICFLRILSDNFNELSELDRKQLGQEFVNETDVDKMDVVIIPYNVKDENIFIDEIEDTIKVTIK